MSRWIDADATRGLLMSRVSLTNGIDSALRDAPTIELVRCKECRFCKLEGDDEEGTHYLWCWRHDTDVNETDFCSWGEREGE